MSTPKLTMARILLLMLIAAVALFWACSPSEKSEQKSDRPATEPVAEAAAQPVPVEFTMASLSALDSYDIACGEQTIDLAGPVAEIAAAIEDSSFLYATKPLTDCSGIFHRVLQRMKNRCPDQAYPPIETYRDTRDLARWYQEQGQFILVKDALAAANLIKPGAVLFYGQRATQYKDFTAEDLFKRGTGINHMGVVVRVKKDEAGNVVSYELFHGHGRPGKTPASTTNYHFREPTRSTYPPFANGNEQWIAFATLGKPTGAALTAK